MVTQCTNLKCRDDGRAGPIMYALRVLRSDILHTFCIWKAAEARRVRGGKGQLGAVGLLVVVAWE